MLGTRPHGYIWYIRNMDFNPFVPEDYIINVVWICHISDNTFGMKHKFTKYLKMSSR